jgi:hypothetical protein
MDTQVKVPEFEHQELSEFDDKKSIGLKTDEEAQPIEVDAAWLAREKSLVRKLHMTLMPIIWLLYLFNYLDRNNIA